MATTPEQDKQNQQDFFDAYNTEPPAEKPQTEDEAFGLGPDTTGADEPTESAQEVAAEAAPEGQSGEGPSVTAAPEGSVAEESQEPPAVEAGEPVDPKDIQREKSWEGRLKVKEAELRAREEALNKAAKPTESPAEVAADGDTPAEEASEPAVTEAVEDAVEKVESGELTVDQAMATLSGDFGEDFTKMLGVLITSKAAEIAGKTADEKVGKVSQKVDGIVSELVSDKARSHFESIADAHPDFTAVAASSEFKEYIDAMDETQKPAAMKVIEAGSARQIIKLLNDFKAKDKAEEKTEPPAVEKTEDPALDAAEGVRSKGLKIPEKPNQSQDYAAAWDDF